jgi:2,3,4,5-tetrahydropyridine-2,6-dicarboxylate N-succinyltransferase
MDDVRRLVEEAAGDVSRLDRPAHRSAVEQAVELLDAGTIRLAEKVDSDSGGAGAGVAGGWRVNAWVQQAILLYFRITEMATHRAGPAEYHDRIPLKQDLARRGVRVVPGGVVRYGSHLEPGVVVMAGFVNIGAYVAAGTMVDTWATVGSGAQIGRHVHLAGGVGIGGVLEPPGARPVIVEDGAFIGSRCIVVEGVVVGERAVLGAQVALTASTHIIDVTQDEPVTYKRQVPPGAIVVPGTRPRSFPGGDYQVACALIIGYRTDDTDQKLALMPEARDFDLGL